MFNRLSKIEENNYYRKKSMQLFQRIILDVIVIWNKAELTAYMDQVDRISECLKASVN